VGVYGSSGPEYDYDFAALQSGLDLYRSVPKEVVLDVGIGVAGGEIEAGIVALAVRVLRRTCLAGFEGARVLKFFGYHVDKAAGLDVGCAERARSG